MLGYKLKINPEMIRDLFSTIFKLYLDILLVEKSSIQALPFLGFTS